MPRAITHDFASGTLREWYANEREDGAGPAVIVDGNVSPADVRHQGRYSAQMTLANPQKRCELVMGDILADGLPMLFGEGERWQFTWNFKLSAAWNNTNASFQLIAQWFPYPSDKFSGSPPVAVLAGSYLYGLATDLQLAQSAGQPTATQTTSVPLSALAPLRGVWTKIRVIIDFSVVAARSRVAVILNDAPIFDAVPTLPTLAGTGPLGTADRCYFKVGYYRDTAIASTDSIIIDNVDARQI